MFKVVVKVLNMAFEDRFSPDTAKSPNSAENQQNSSPESSRTSVYTCQIISNFGSQRSPRQEELPEKANFFRITSFALNNENSSSSSSSSCEESSSLKYSIDNILQPDFGKSAILKTKTPICSKISFKPYERNNSFTNSLGSLSQTVNQIGAKSDKVLLEEKSSIKNVPVPEPKTENKDHDKDLPQLWPAWVYCTRYSDRPSSGTSNFRFFELQLHFY